MNGVFEGCAIEIFHGDKSFSALVANVADSGNVRMIQSGSSLGLTFESFQGLGIVGEVSWEELQSDETVESGVLSFVDDADAAAAEFFEDAVVGNGLSKQGGESAIWRTS